MAFTVHVENFQSLSDVTVKVDGLTVITGTNNAGKSALMRAIRAAFQNTKGTSYIRHGQTKTTVEVNFDDGASVRWSKGRGASDKPTYVVNGGQPIHPGQAVPDEVRNLMVKPINVGNKEVWPQFAPQFTGQVFLLDQPGSVIAEAVSDINHVSQLNEALRSAESDKRSVASELKIRLVDQTNSAELVKKYTGLDDVDAFVSNIELDYSKLEKLASATAVVTSLRDRLAMMSDLVGCLDNVNTINIPPEEDIRLIDKSMSAIEYATASFAKLSGLSDTIRSLESMTPKDIPSDSETNECYSLITSINQLSDLLDRVETSRSVVSALNGIDTVQDVDVNDAILVYDNLVMVSSLNDKLLLAIGVEKQHNDDLELAIRDLSAIASEVSSTLGELGECPTCGSIHVGEHK